MTASPPLLRDGQSILAVIPVRGELPAGAAEVAAEANGQCLLVGAGCVDAAADLAGIATNVTVWEAGAYQPAAWANALASIVASMSVVLCPATPDGRDLAARLAYCLDRPLLSSVIAISSTGARVIRFGGRAEELHDLANPVVATMAPHARSVTPDHRALPPIEVLRAATMPGFTSNDPETVSELPADPTTMDLVEANRIVAGGAGLNDAAELAALGTIGAALGASLGATRVVTDAGWTGHERQIGTTGVEVDPDLYLAFGISGAVQHVMGLGNPDHIISVNTDPSCPMMTMADLAIVADAPATIAALHERVTAMTAAEVPNDA